MAEPGREAWITGIGIVSCLGEEPEAHWQALGKGTVRADVTTFAPYVVHPLVPIELDKQIPKKGDQRQMEPWQRIGTYAAGLALAGAGLKGNAELLARTDLIVAAGGGERDCAVDSTILTGLPAAANPGAYLNERLMNDLRPTLFLAQLSNLLAGNISIVHGVTSSSRTFMGEESACVDAIRIATARITSGQSDIVLVGGSHNGERKDLLLLYELGGFALKDRWAPVFERAARGGGVALGSLGAFVVVESSAHALKRAAPALAKISRVLSEHARRRPGAVTATLDRLWADLAPNLAPGRHAIISGATGAEPATGEERAFLAKHNHVPVLASGSYIGHGIEAQFAMNVSLAALAVRHQRFFPAAVAGNVELSAPLTQVVVTSVGHWRGEGIALVESAT